MEVSMFWLVFKLGIIFEMNDKTTIEFGFLIIWRIKEILEGVVCLSQLTSSLISIILQMLMILSLIHKLLNIIDTSLPDS